MAAALARSRDRVATTAAPPLGLMHEPRRAKVTGVSTAHHEEVGGTFFSFYGNRGLTPNPRSEATEVRR
jgi:hypothetical protein